MTLIAAGAFDNRLSAALQPRDPNTQPELSPGNSKKVVALLVRCQATRSQLKSSDRALSPSSRAVCAESKALSPAELEWLRTAKEHAGTYEWAQLKKRAKAAAQSTEETRRNLPGIKPSKHEAAPRATRTEEATRAPAGGRGPAGANATPKAEAVTRERSVRARAELAAAQDRAVLDKAHADVTRLQNQLAATEQQLESLAAQQPRSPAPQPALSAGVLRSACLEKELSSDGGDDLDIAAMNELEEWSTRGEKLVADVRLLAHVLPGVRDTPRTWKVHTA
jgi:hypothetical protein